MLLLIVALCGCTGGAEKFNVAPVKGKVLCDGKPVPEGIVQFAPVAKGSNPRTGKTGIAEIQPDGTFVVSTYLEGDGVVIGRCRVTTGSSDPDKPWACTLAGPLDYEIKPGGDDVVIELLPDGSGTISPAGG
jgi:hypothetical protein